MEAEWHGCVASHHDDNNSNPISIIRHYFQSLMRYFNVHGA